MDISYPETESWYYIYSTQYYTDLLYVYFISMRQIPLSYTIEILQGLYARKDECWLRLIYILTPSCELLIFSSSLVG